MGWNGAGNGVDHGADHPDDGFKQYGLIAAGIGVATAVECTWRCSRSSCPRKSRVSRLKVSFNGGDIQKPQDDLKLAQIQRSSCPIW